MAALTVTQVLSAGVVDALVAAAGGGDTFANDGRVFFDANNASGGSITVTFAVPAKVQGLTITALAVAVGAGVRKKIGPFPPELFNDASGLVSVSYSGVTTFTVGAYRL